MKLWALAAASALIITPALAQPSAGAPTAPAAAEAAPAGEPAPAPSAAPAAEATAPQVTTPADVAPTLGTPATGKGQIVFWRNSFQGMLLRCTVREDGALVSALPNGRYFIRDVEPGLHTFTAATEAKDTLRLEVEAGEVYYNRCSIAMGIMVGRPNLSPSDKAAFEKASEKLKLREPRATEED